MRLPTSITWRYALGSVLLAGVYWLAGRLGLQLAFVHANATAVWPPTGIALAALLLWGYGLSPGVFVGAFLVNVTAQGTTFGDVPTCLGIATGNTLEALAGTWLVRRFAGGRRFAERTADLVKFAVLAGMVSTLLSSTIGVASLGLGGHAKWEDFASIWFTWWLGDAVGAMVVAPPILLWANDPRPRWTWNRAIEAALLGVVLVAVSLLIFGPFSGFNNAPVTFAILPLLVGMAIRFGPRETATGVLVLSGFALVGTLEGAGPFGDQPGHIGLLLLQAFVAVSALTSLILASLVTERRRAEDELKQFQSVLEDRVHERSVALAQANEAFKWIVENVKDYAIFVLDLQGRVVTWNAGAERIMGYRTEEVVGKPSSVFYPEEEVSRGRPAEMLQKAVTDGRCEEETWRVRKDGSRYWANVILTPLRDQSGSLRGFAQVTRDITARKDVEEKLRHTERLAAMGEMITGLAHESRNALQRSQACLELLQLKAHDRPDLHELIADIERSQDHIRYLFEEVRGYARPVRLKLQSVDLGKLLRETWQQLEPARRGRDTHLEEQPPDFDLSCPADPIALAQVFRNILENSLSACPDPVVVRVSWSEVRHEGRPGIRVCLRDNGPGFTAEARQKLFEPFFTTKMQGTGLGMAIAKRIVEAHGGAITAGANGVPGAEVVVIVSKGTP